MQIKVCDREELERYRWDAPQCVLISITDPDKAPAEIRQSDRCLEVLRLQFHDIQPGPGAATIGGMTSMDADHARQIWQFVQRWRDEAQTLVVQCEAGMSRSPAVAAAVAEYLGQDSGVFFADYAPNRYIYEMLRRNRPGAG